MLGFSFLKNIRDIIDRNLTGNEHLGWIEALISGMGEDHVYNVPVFRKKLDVLDIENTTFVPGTDHIIQPCFSIEKVTSLSIFPKPGKFSEIPTAIYVNDAIRSEMIEAGVTGVGFSETALQWIDPTGNSRKF